MANNTRKKHAREQVKRSFTNIDSASVAATMRKVSLSTLATVLTAATCLGGEPILASSNILLPPTTAAFAEEVRKDDPNPWLHTPNILEYQRWRFQNSNGDAGYVSPDDHLGNYDDLKNKTDMYAHVEETNGTKYLVFDVFFNNDGKSMLTSSKKQQYVWLVPYAVADLDNGRYKGDTVTELRFDFYKRNGRSPKTYANLSHDIGLFDYVADKSFDQNLFNNDRSHNGSTYKYSMNVRNGRSRGQDISDNFHVREKDLDDAIKKAIAPGPSPYSGYNYGIGITTVNVDYAVRMHCKVKLRKGVTRDEIQNAFTYANTSSYGRSTHSAYTFISGRTHDESFTRTKSDNLPPKLYLNGKEISDSNNSIDVYQGESPKITFGTSDNSEKVTNFSVKGFPDSIKANFNKNSNDGFDATEKNPYKHEINGVKFEHKDEKNNPVNSDYTITVSATDASGNKAEKTITVHLRNQNLKHKAPTATPITVDWGHKPAEDELKKHVSGADGGTLTFDSIPETKIPEQYFNGKDTLPAHASGKVTYSDGSYHNVTVPVNVKKPLSLQHKLNENTVNATVGDALTKTGNKVDAKEYLGNLDNATKKSIKSAEWVNGEPSTDVAGKRTYTAKVTFNDGSTAEEKVTFTVRPKQPKIETDLTGVAGVKDKEVVVDAGSGTEGSTVTLKDKSGNQIGTGKVGADGKAKITVAKGIPEGDITAVTTTADSVSSDASDAKNASKDNQKPTLTADKDSVTVKVGEDLKIKLTAKDDVKIESINAATATMAFARNDFSKMMAVAERAKTAYTKDTATEKKLTYTFSGFKPEEVGTYNLTFSATDAAGNKVEKTVTVKVEKKEDIKPRNITVDLNHTLNKEDAKKAIANNRKLPKGTTFEWSTEKDGKPDTSTVGKEKPGTVIVTIPTNDPKNPRVETVKVKVTVKDRKEPEVTIKQKSDGGYTDIDIKNETVGKITTKIATITTYRGDKNDIKITAKDNSGNVTTLTLEPAVPGETTGTATGTGTTADPKTLTLDGTTPLNTKPGEYTRTITAVDPSKNTTKITVKFVVKTQAEKYDDVKGTPVTYNMSDGTKHPDPKSGINAEAVKNLPNGTKYSWAQEPDWNKTVKDTTAKVLITFPDGSTKKVDTKVTVKDDIAPVILEPHTNKGEHNNQGKKEFPYMFKVHKDKSFDIEINAYDNSGKIKSATVESFPGHDNNITIDKQNDNSAEKPATIHIKGTGNRTDLNVPEKNKWTRTLTVTDNAGKQSTLNIQISVYTDAEEHTATAKQVDKNNGDNISEKDITNAITITNKDSKDPKIKPTFTVTKPLPENTATGMHTVPVTVKYPDGSTTVVDVPVKIGSAAKTYDPQGNTITVPWHSKEDLATKIKSFGKGKGLKWNKDKQPAKDPTVTIVDNSSVPSTDKPGESKVQVEVKYSDGSSDVATVTVKVLDPQSETYTPEGQTIKVDYKTPKADISSKIKGVGTGNGIKLKKNGETTDLTKLPDDVASIAIDDDKTVPDGTQPGDFTVPVTITYKDGSKSRATVKVTVGKPQSETHTPTTSEIQVGYNGTAPTPDEIIKKVTVPNKPDKTTITVDKNQTPIDTTTPGTVNVKVTVKYPDGSEDHVEVPVTVGNPDNETYKPSAEEVKKNRRDKITAEDITSAVKIPTVDDKPAPKGTTVELVNENSLPDMTKTGTTNVPVKVTYPDGSSTVVQVPVIVTDTNADEYTPNVDPVEKPYGTDEATIKKAITDAVKVTDWPEKSDKKPTYEIAKGETIPSGTEPGTKKVKVKVTYPDKTSEDVIVDVTIKNKQSDTFEPKVTPVVEQYGKKVTSEDVTKNVTVPGWPENKKNDLKIELNDHNKALPDGKTPGTTNVQVKITYPDKTEKVVEVPVTIKNKQSELYPPTSKEITKENGTAPTEDEIKKAVSVPTWPAGEKDKPTYSIAEGDKSKIHNGDKAGKFEVPVTVTYPDGSTTVINVPVIINAPTPEAKTGVTVPTGADPKPEDMISNKDKFPEGTTFEWDKKPDTSKESNGVTHKVKITIPGSNTTQEVTVTVNVVKPTASEVNVPQGKDLPKPEAVINGSTDKNKYPQGTKFEWSKEDTPDTNNPGTKNSKIIVTIPGQKPVEVPVTVNVTPNPEANVVNVKVGDKLPDASNGIANKDKFPDGTKYTWKNNGPSTTTSGKTTGTVLVHIPGVKDPVEATVTVNVNPAPIAKDTSVIQNSDPDPKNSIEDNNKLPEGTTFVWKKGYAPKTDKPGTTNGTVIVKIPGQDPQEVPVTITVTASPEGKDITVLQKKDGDTTGTNLQPGDLISNKNKLNGATFDWKKQPDTSKTGNQTGVVTVTVPGEPDVDIPVNVLVVPNPEAKKVSVHVGDSPSAENSIANKDELPKGTKFAWATNGTPDTNTAGDNKSGTVVVTIPNIEKPVEVKVKVNVVDKDKPFINDGNAENTPTKPDKTTITGKTQPGNTVTVKDKDDKTVGTGTSDNDGNFTIEIDKKDPGTDLKLIPSKDGENGDPVNTTITAKPQRPTIKVPTSDDKNGENVTVTPPDGDENVVKIVINDKPNPLNGPEKPEQTIIVKKGDDGKWEIDGDTPDGVKVDPNTGVVTIPAKDLEDGSTITAVSKNKTDKPSDPATAVTGFKTPQITQKTLKDNPDDSTKQIITGKTLPGAKVTVTDKDGNQIGTGTAGSDGSFTITINKQNPGTIITLTPTNGKGDGAKTGDSVNITVGGNIANPKIDTPADGGASVTPDESDTRVNKVVVTYTPEGSETTATITVVAEGDKHEWKIDGSAPNGVTVDSQTGKVTIPSDKIKHGSNITAQSEDSGDKTGNSKSGEVTAKVSEKENPTPTPTPEPTPTPTPEPSPEPTPSPIPTDKPLVVTPQNGEEQGSATVTPPADADSMEITFIPENEETFSGIGETEIPSYEEVTPEVIYPDSQEPGNNPGNTQGNTSGNVTPGDNTTGNGTDGKGTTGNGTEGNKTPRVTIKIKKDEEGNWKIVGNAPEGVTVDPQTGKVTIPANKVKDNTEVTAKSKKVEETSEEANGNTGKDPEGAQPGQNPDQNPWQNPDSPTPEDWLNPERWLIPLPTPWHNYNPAQNTGANQNSDTAQKYTPAQNQNSDGNAPGTTANNGSANNGSANNSGADNNSANNNSAKSGENTNKRRSSGEIKKSKLGETGSAIAAAAAVTAIAAAIGTAFAVIARKKKRK